MSEDSLELSRRLGVGVRERARRIAGGIGRRLRTHLWYPHVPLFIAVACLGVFDLVPIVRNALGTTPSTESMLAASRGILDALARGAPEIVTGVFLVIMSLGLLARSRLAWLITLLVTSATLLLYLFGGMPQPYSALVVYNAILIVALLLGYRHFSRSSVAGASLFATASVLSLLGYAIAGAFILGDQFKPAITDLVTALYFSIVTMSTVGYGDISPQTPTARLFVVSVIILGITIFATSLSALVVPLISQRMQLLLRNGDRKMNRSGHYIIVGDTALARNSYKELKARDQAVTFILTNAPTEAADDRDIIVGDASDLDTLERADAARAKAILALGDDDSENAFVALAAKEASSTVKTVVAVNDARNLSRVKRVHPDLIIAPHILGGELLAMALSGEPLDSERLMQQLLHFAS